MLEEKPIPSNPLGARACGVRAGRLHKPSDAIHKVSLRGGGEGYRDAAGRVWQCSPDFGGWLPISILRAD